MNDYHKTLTFDIETDGLPPKNAAWETDFLKFPHVVSIAWKIDDNETKHYILNQEGREIPIEVSNIHGITTEIANASCHMFEEVIAETIEDAMDCEIIVGHNMYFDTSIIKAGVLKKIASKQLPEDTIDKINIMLDKAKRIDTMRSYTSKFGGKWPKLTELYMKAFSKEFNAHCAKDDVDATREIYKWEIEQGICLTYEQLQEKNKLKELAQKGNNNELS